MIAFFLVTLREDSKSINDAIMLDFRNGFYIQGTIFVLMLLFYLPFTIPYTIIKLIRDNYGK
jgi:hypothetical protein